MRRAGAASLAGVLAMAGCSTHGAPGPPRTTPAPAPSGTGYFVGTAPDGVGASLDLLGDDQVVRVLDDALRAQDGRPGTVAAAGIVSVVNEGPLGIAMPRFVAELGDGRAVALRTPGALLRPGDGPAARRALRRLARVPTRVPGEGAATAYVVLSGAAPAAVQAVRMVVVRGAPVTLTARRR